MIFKNKGFTLMESLIVITILGILAIVAVPLLRNSLYNSKIKAGSNVLNAALSYARANATKYNCYYFLHFVNCNGKLCEIDIYRDTNSSLDGNFNDPGDNIYPDPSDHTKVIKPLEKKLYLPQGTEFVLHDHGCNLRQYSFLSIKNVLIIKPDGTLLPADQTHWWESYIGIKISGLNDNEMNDNTFARFKITNIGIAEFSPHSW